MLPGTRSSRSHRLVPSNVDTIWNNQIAIGKDHQSIQREKEKEKVKIMNLCVELLFVFKSPIVFCDLP
jgi:hypothetical protein